MTSAAKEAEFAKRSCKLLGLSIDSLYAQIAWLRTIKEEINAILYDPFSNGRHVDEVLRLLTTIQTTDAHGVATPANWPPGDDVIVPPPASCGGPGSAPKPRMPTSPAWIGLCV